MVGVVLNLMKPGMGIGPNMEIPKRHMDPNMDMDERATTTMSTNPNMDLVMGKVTMMRKFGIRV